MVQCAELLLSSDGVTGRAGIRVELGHPNYRAGAGTGTGKGAGTGVGTGAVPGGPGFLSGAGTVRVRARVRCGRT